MNSIFGSFDDLYLFCRVVDAGSLQQAAQSLRLPVSTMSRKLTALEARLGVRLLERKGRQLAATETGQLFYDHLSGEFSLQEESLLQLLSPAQQVSGNIRLRLPYTMYQQTVSRVVEQFLLDNPSVSIDIKLSLDNSIPITDRDLVIGFDRSRDANFIARPYFTSHNQLFASTAYLEQRGAPQSHEDLMDHDWVVVDSHRVLQMKNAKGESFTLQKSPRVVVNDIRMLVQTVKAGLGIASIPSHHVSPESGLVELLPSYQLESRQAYIYYKRRDYQPRALSLLVERLLESSPDSR